MVLVYRRAMAALERREKCLGRYKGKKLPPKQYRMLRKLYDWEGHEEQVRYNRTVENYKNGVAF